MQLLVGVHTFWRWIVLLVIVVALIRGIVGWMRGGRWTGADRTLGLLTTSVIDIQVLIGLILYGIGQHWNDPSTFIRYVHPLVMLVALVVIHVVNVRVKRLDSPIARHRLFTIGLLITIFLITAAIPSYSWARFWVS